MPFSPVCTEAAIPAAKVIREKAAHSVRVGEDQRSSSEMEVLLAQTAEKKVYWWAWALAIGLVAVIFIGWYFSENGVDTTSTANTKPLVPEDTASPSYRLLP